VAEKKPLEIGDVLPPKQLIELEHLYNRDNTVYCVRPSCVGCQHDPNCTREETFIKIGPGINIREAFRSRPGYKWACIDFAGIELRVAALLSGEPVWVQAFQEDRDLHEEMAKIMFKTDEPDKAQRDIAKMGNFGNLYLSGVDTFWHLTTLTFNEAAIAWKKWWAAVPVYEKWTKIQEAYYRKHGHVWTFFHRKREMKHMIELAEANVGKGKGKKSGRKIGHGFCKRTACNSPVQGTSADLLKLAMTLVDDFLTREKLRDDVKMMLTVHDELDFEIRDTPAMFEILREIGRQMTLTSKGEVLPRIPHWTIPLKVDIEIGDNWGNLTGIDDLDPQTKDLPKKSEKETPKSDKVVLLVPPLTGSDIYKLRSAIFEAGRADNVVKVPLVVRTLYSEYPYNTVAGKVSEGHLRKLIQKINIPGIKVVSDTTP
jgi:DNA polymerase-1